MTDEYPIEMIDFTKLCWKWWNTTKYDPKQYEAILGQKHDIILALKTRPEEKESESLSKHRAIYRSMRRVGMVNPMIIAKVSDGQYNVIVGNQRITCMKAMWYHEPSRFARLFPGSMVRCRVIKEGDTWSDYTNANRVHPKTEVALTAPDVSPHRIVVVGHNYEKLITTQGMVQDTTKEEAIAVYNGPLNEPPGTPVPGAEHQMAHFIVPNDPIGRDVAMYRHAILAYPDTSWWMCINDDLRGFQPEWWDFIREAMSRRKVKICGQANLASWIPKAMAHPTHHRYGSAPRFIRTSYFAVRPDFFVTVADHVRPAFGENAQAFEKATMTLAGGRYRLFEPAWLMWDSNVRQAAEARMQGEI